MPNLCIDAREPCCYQWFWEPSICKPTFMNTTNNNNKITTSESLTNKEQRFLFQCFFLNCGYYNCSVFWEWNTIDGQIQTFMCKCNLQDDSWSNDYHYSWSLRLTTKIKEPWLYDNYLDELGTALNSFSSVHFPLPSIGSNFLRSKEIFSFFSQS